MIVDYILFGQIPKNKPDIQFNPKEIQQVVWCNLEEFQKFIAEKPKIGQPIAPWLLKMIDCGLLDWWRTFAEIKSIKSYPEVNSKHHIHL